MVSTIQVLVSPRWVSSHLVRPSKIWFILNSIHNPVHRFLEGHIHLPIYGLGSWILKSFRGLDWKPICWGWFVTEALPLFYNRSSSNCLYSLICLINYLISSGGLLVNDSCSPESSSNPIRKVLSANLFITSANLVIQFPISANVTAKGFPSPHFHWKQRGHGLWNSAAGNELYTKLLNQFGKIVNQAFP